MQNKKLYESIPFESKRNSVKIFKTVTGGNGVFRPHWHEHMELLYVTSGKGTVMCRDEYFKVEQGDLLVFNGNDLHSGYRCDREFSYITVIYDTAILSSMNENNFPVIATEVKQDKIINSKFQIIDHELSTRGTLFEYVMLSCAYEVLVRLVRNYCIATLGDNDYKFRMNNLGRLNEVVRYIDENIGKTPLTTKELSSYINLSEFYFCHIFKDIFKQSPIKYINSQKIMRSKLLLRESDSSIAEIAEICGFYDPNYYTRCFKSTCGMTPSEYRIAHRNSKNN